MKLSPLTPVCTGVQMANPDIGRIKVTYRRVECAPPESVQVSVLDFAGSNGWLRLNIQVSEQAGVAAMPAAFLQQASSGCATISGRQSIP